jgi:protein O-GlcNAc transferase
MNIRAFVEALPAAYWQWGTLNAVPYELRRYAEVLGCVQGMTTPSNMHLLNLAVQQLAPNECYLEVGTWRGATLIGALLGNTAQGVAIDDDTMDDHDEDTEKSWDVCGRNLAEFEITSRVHQINGSVPAVWEGLQVPPVGVYLFDGDKSTAEAAWEGLIGVLPFLSSEALIVLDDANEINIRMAAHELCTRYPQHVFKMIDIPTPGNCWPMWWNGIMVLGWRG